MKTLTFIAAAVSAGLAFASQARSAELPLPKEGWASWQVEAVEDAPAWCCWSSWGDHNADTQTCKLDGERQGYGSRDHAKTSSVRMYAHLTGGKVDKLRSLAAACPVEAKTPIQKIDAVSTDDSARWLIDLSKQTPVTAQRHGDFGEDILAAIAMHKGDIAMNALTTKARSDSNVEVRKHAIFWLGEMRGAPGADVVSTAMFGDQDPEVRKHAAFAMTLTGLARATPDLIKLGNTDKDGDVRSQAWFWLSHTGAKEAEGAIFAALKKDPDGHVQEQAVFALSQLPNERSTKALISIAEDRSLSNEQRKKALFWLGQSDKADAQAYLEKVLTKGAAN